MVEIDVGADFGRGATENMVVAAAQRGVRTAVIRAAATWTCWPDYGSGSKY